MSQEQEHKLFNFVQLSQECKTFYDDIDQDYRILKLSLIGLEILHLDHTKQRCVVLASLYALDDIFDTVLSDDVLVFVIDRLQGRKTVVIYDLIQVGVRVFNLNEDL